MFVRNKISFKRSKENNTDASYVTLCMPKKKVYKQNDDDDDDDDDDDGRSPRVKAWQHDDCSSTITFSNSC